MKHSKFSTLAAVVVSTVFSSAALAHGGDKHITLHVNPRWSECSFQLDASLTQQAWRQFTKEAGQVVYFRSLTDAKPMGTGNYEVSLLQWSTNIDESQPAWNDTFVHPDSVHWLIGGDRLAFPGLMARAGITDKIDFAAYVTKAPGANYGFLGGQVQYNLVNNVAKDWAASARVSFVSIYGPDDIDYTVYGADLTASKLVATYSDWARVSAYGVVSAYLGRSHEKSAVVNLADESVLGVQGSVGIAAQLSVARVSAEYNMASLNTISFKVGMGF